MSSSLLVYLDMCCFNRPYDDQLSDRIKLETQAKLFIQNEITNGKIDLVWSYILDIENYENPFLEKKISISRWKSVAKINIEPIAEVRELAVKLEHQLGIRAKDANHLACSIYSKSNFLLTTDKEFISRTRDNMNNVSVINPVDFLIQMGDA